MFSLTKWYGDCVSEEGKAFVGYWAELRWRGFEIRYASRLGEGGERTTILAGKGPARAGEGYEWCEPAIGVEAQWEPFVPAFAATIFAGEHGSIQWNCLAPAARTRAQGLAGLGYLERIEITAAPWALPIDSLHWGRYLATVESVVWIDWRGCYRRRLVLQNGQEVEAESIEREGLALASGERLEFDCGHSLRQGDLGENVLSKIAGLRNLLPVRLLKVNEQKWLSRGRVFMGGRVLSEGWAIHEVVKWPPQ